MHCQTKKISDLTYRFHFKLPIKDLEAEVERRLHELSRKAKVDGFRPGNVDLRVVRQKYGDGVLKEVLEDELREAYVRAVKDDNLQPVSTPQFKRDESARGDDYEFIAEVEVVPEFELADLRGLTVEKVQVDIEDDDLAKLVDDLRRQAATYRPVVRPAADGDRVLVRFENAEHARMFGATGEDGSMHLNVSDADGAWSAPLVGAIPGDRCGLTKPGSEDKPREKSRIILPGQAERPADPDEIGVVVKDVEECVLPPVDEEFLKRFDAADADDLNTRLRAGAEHELARRLRTMFRDAIVEEVVNAHKIPLPPSMVQEQIESMRHNTAQYMGVDKERLGDDELFRPQAERTVKLSLIMDKIIEGADEIKVDDREIDAHLAEMTKMGEEGKRMAEHYRQDEQARRRLEQMILEDKVFVWMEERVKVSEKSRKFSEVMSGA